MKQKECIALLWVIVILLGIIGSEYHQRNTVDNIEKVEVYEQ
jgi:hypothetical protein